MSSPTNPDTTSRSLAARAVFAFLVGLLGAAVPDAAAQERMLFPRKDDIKAAIIAKINSERVRLDISSWYFTEHEISVAVVNRFKAGVPVRILADRVSAFMNDVNMRRELEYLATNGVPIRMRYFPTHFPEIMHWKAGIFVGQNVVEFGSANWTPFELRPASATNYKDETAMFSDDPDLVNAFKTRFDQFWVDTTYFLDFPTAYRREFGIDWTTPMNIARVRLEPDYPMPAGLIWGQGTEQNTAMAAAIDRETLGIGMVVYRLSAPTVTDALVRRLKAGVPVRVFVEPTQYREDQFPEYELTGANIDRLWAAGAKVKVRTHAGLTHMKVLITSNTAMHGSSNFTRNWQRDHNYFISALEKPSLYFALKDEFDHMWSDTVNYTSLYPKPPLAATLQSPADRITGVPTLPKLTWNRSAWAVAYDVYLGTSAGSLVFQQRVNAVLSENPPATCSWTAPTALQSGRTYFWKVVARTFATDIDPSLVAHSAVWSFTVSGSGGTTESTPFGGTPVSLPGRIQAENFDDGGANVAYVDGSPGNSGGQHRNTDVDIETTTDTGGGFNVGWTGVGEWLKYTVNVATSGTYDIGVRVTASGTGGTFHVEVNGVDKTGPLVIPNTGGWQNWTTVTKAGVSLTAGRQVWRLVFDRAGSVVGNVNFINVASAGSTPPAESAPYSGAPASLPGTLQAEDFDLGGQGLAWFDSTAGNSGGTYRPGDVDIETTSDTGGGYNVGWMARGEWLKYTASMSTAGTYNIEVRVAAAGSGGTFHIEVNGVDKTGPLVIPNTGGWQNWTTVRKTGVTLGVGRQVWRLVIDAAGPTGVVGNINAIRVVR